MDFEFSDEQRQLTDTVNRFLTDRYGLDKYRAVKASAAGWDKAVWAGLADLGLLALNVPEEQEGGTVTAGLCDVRDPSGIPMLDEMSSSVRR